MSSISENLVSFSKGWGSYVEACKRPDGNFSVTSNHKIYHLLIKKIVRQIEGIIDTNHFKIKASVGQSGLAGIPWLAIMNKNVTTSTQDGFYIAYLFSRNGKYLYLCICLGAYQFEELYGKNSRTTKKIALARDKFVRNFEEYSPTSHIQAMDLLSKDDDDFVRPLTTNIKRKAEDYMSGAFFTKSYNLNNRNFTEADFINDISNYTKSYLDIIKDPLSSIILENLDEAVFTKENQKSKIDYNYELPEFHPIDIRKENKSAVSHQPNTKRLSVPSKKVGNAGEVYVYEYEKSKLLKMGRPDLAAKIVKQYAISNDFPGYDIQSFDENGEEIYIEVKSTKGKKKNSFEISVNEIKSAKKYGKKYYIYQVTSALTNPIISTVIKDLISYESKEQILIEPISYRVHFKECS